MQILVANEMACELFCYSTNELVGMKMSSLLSVNDRKQPEALCEQHLEDNGEVVMVSGKVVSIIYNPSTFISGGGRAVLRAHQTQALFSRVWVRVLVLTLVSFQARHLIKIAASFG